MFRTAARWLDRAAGIASGARQQHQQQPVTSPPTKLNSTPSAAPDTQQQLTAAQLRIAQLLCTPEVAAWDKMLQTLQMTERDMQQIMSDFRYTQMSLTATHRALQDEIKDCLTTCALTGTSELRRAASKAKAKEVLSRHVGFRARRVSEIAPPAHAASRSLGAVTP